MLSIKRYFIYIGLFLVFNFALLPLKAESEPEAEEAASTEQEADDLLGMDLADLLNLEVTSVSKKAQKLIEAPAAIYIITQEDIQRSGATSIPEALRMVPGMEVAHLDGNKWAISARGLNKQYSDQLLVLIDGRSVYTPLFAGVYWDLQDVILEDIERIEVIRGPGGTLWGANAVNGVINIITKQARDTQGFLVSGGGGTEEKGFGSLRYGGKWSEEVFFRVYGKYFNRDEAIDIATHKSGADDWETARGGFRLDWDCSDSDMFTLQGDYYEGNSGERVTSTYLDIKDKDTDSRGGNLLGRWGHTFSESSDMSVQLYYDHTERDVFQLGERRDTLDFEFQHRFPFGEVHDVIWGLGYRLTRDKTEETVVVQLDPADRTDNLLSAFIQDDIALCEDKCHLILGTKLELNNYTGWEYQPNARFVWNFHPDHMAWAAASRAVQVPTRISSDGRLNLAMITTPGGSMLLSFFGDDDVKSQEVIAYEAGYRLQATESVFFDLAGFFNNYDNLHSSESGSMFFETSPAPPHMTIPLVRGNKLSGESYGVEVAGNWQVCPWWKLSSGYSFIQLQLHIDNDSSDTNNEGETEGSTPHHQAHLRSYINLPKGWSFDTALYYVDSLPALGTPSYIRCDARVAWQINENLELSIVGQNLLDNRHPEFAEMTNGFNGTEVQRSVYAKFTYRF